jgi:two-component system, NtrC family, sensor histidine kinase HydH
LAVAAVILAIGTLHYVTPWQLERWHNAFQHVCYLPVIAAGLFYGWRGGAAAGLLAGAVLTPHIVMAWDPAESYHFDQILEIPLLISVGLLTGVLVERERDQRRVLERTTKQLADVYSELQQNFERMKRAERLYAVGQLSAGLAHEIRNPLASIAGASGILRRHSQDSARRDECLEIIQRECERLGRLLAGFLDFARPRTPRYRHVELGPLLDEMMQLASHAARQKGVPLHHDPVALAASIECDPEQVKQVLLNLLINAIQASPEGALVTLSAHAGGDQVRIEVRDNGWGISPEDRDKIFDPFFTTKENGTGLGLSVAHQIVEQHGGILTAEENPDCGMTFTVRLPVNQATTL